MYMSRERINNNGSIIAIAERMAIQMNDYHLDIQKISNHNISSISYSKRFQLITKTLRY